MQLFFKALVGHTKAPSVSIIRHLVWLMDHKRTQHKISIQPALENDRHLIYMVALFLGCFFFFFFPANHANFPSVPSGINSRLQFHAVHFPSPKESVDRRGGNCFERRKYGILPGHRQHQISQG